MSYVAKNNAYGLLAAGLTASDETMTLQAGQGDRFPVIAAPDYTFITLEDAGGNREIVKAVLRPAASDVITIARAQEGSPARTWAAGDVAEQRMVASLVQNAMGHSEKTSGAHAASAISAPATGTLETGTVASQLAALEAGKQPAFSILGIAKGGTGGKTRHEALSALGVEAGEVAVQTTDTATTDIAAAASQNVLLTLGSASITGFAPAEAGITRRVRVGQAGITMVHGASFVLPGAANISPVVGDCFEAFSTGSAWIVRNYQKADGKALVSPSVPVTSVFGRTGAVALQSGDVTGALGYTPANVSHGHDYAPSTAFTSASTYTTNSGYVTAYYLRLIRHNGGYQDVLVSSVNNDPGGSSCVHPSSLIMMHDGSEKFACDVRPGDMVATLDGPDTVVAVKRVPLGNRPMVEVNHALVITPDHLLPAPAGWCAFDPEMYEEQTYLKRYALKTRKGLVMALGGEVHPDAVDSLRAGALVVGPDGLISIDSAAEYRFDDLTQPVITFLLARANTFIADGFAVAALAKDSQ